MLCLQELGIQPTARHANPLIFAEAMFVSAHTAINGPLKEMQQGRLGEGCRPNADSYNCIIMVRSMLWDSGRFQKHKSLVPLYASPWPCSLAHLLSKESNLENECLPDAAPCNSSRCEVLL